MQLVYLDYNCFQRSFDDPRQTRIQLEALACQELFARAQRGQLRLAWSSIHELESQVCPFPDRALEVLQLSRLCRIRVGPDDRVRSRAVELQGSVGISSMDALHLACACQIRADVMLTCDDELVKRSQRISLETTVLNPVDYIRRETS
jgi:hypothetical protein